MKITMIGHASVMIETHDCSIIMDPILADPHQRGIFEISPERKVNHSKIPTPDIIIISHRHLDHFDIHSLSLLNKRAEVLFPKDNLIDTSLERMGYINRIPLDAWTQIEYGNTRIITTPSECPVPEFGVLIQDCEHSYWNQVDTIVNSEILNAVENEFGVLDVVQAPWQPMLETSYLWGESFKFPFDEYKRVLSRLKNLKTKLLIPGANGFKYVGNSEWQNRVVFPLTKERFISDLEGLRKNRIEITYLSPGDSLTLNNHENGGWTLSENSSEFVKTVNTDQSQLYFFPNLPHNKNIFCSRNSTKKNRVIGEIEGLIKKCEPLIKAMRKWCVIYELYIDYGNHLEIWLTDFNKELISLENKQSPNTNYRAYITSHALEALASGRDSWANIIPSGDYRTSRFIYKLENGELVKPTNSEIPDVLWSIYKHEELLISFIDREIEKLT